MEAAIRELTREALDRKAADLKRGLFEMKVKKGFGQLEQTAAPKVQRRQRARLLTAAREDELGVRKLAGTRMDIEDKKAKTAAEKAAAPRAVKPRPPPRRPSRVAKKAPRGARRRASSTGSGSAGAAERGGNDPGSAGQKNQDRHRGLGQDEQDRFRDPDAARPPSAL